MVVRVQLAGERVLVWVDGGRPTTFSGNGKDITSAVPALRETAASLGSHPAVLDGVLTSDPVRLASLRKRLRAGSPSQVRRLAAAAPTTLLAYDGATWHTAPRFDDGRSVLDAAREQGLPGLVAKLRASRYRTGVECDDWRVVDA